MKRSAALLLVVVFGLANTAMGVAGYIVSRRRFPDLIEPLHVQFILLACGLLLGAVIILSQRMNRAGKTPNGWIYVLSELPALLAFTMLGWRGLFAPSLAPLICTSLVQFAVLLPVTAKLGR